jgi:hypothetical protein
MTIYAGRAKNLTAVVATGSTGAPFISASWGGPALYALIRLESADASNGFVWTSASTWVATVPGTASYPTASHLGGGLWNHTLVAGATTNRQGQFIHYLFMDKDGMANEASASIICNGGEHEITDIDRLSAITGSVWGTNAYLFTTAGTSGKILSELSSTAATYCSQSVWKPYHITTDVVNNVSASVWQAFLFSLTGGFGPETAASIMLSLPTTASFITTASFNEMVSGSVWNADLANHTTAGSAGRYLTDASGSGAVTVDYAAISASVWNAATANHSTAGTFGLRVPSNLTAIDGQLTNGFNATLNLKQLNVVNSNGDAALFSSSGGGGSGIVAIGNAAGGGLKGIGGSGGGHGIWGSSNGGGGFGIAGYGSTTGAGIYGTAGSSGPGILGVGVAGGAGVEGRGGASGPGIKGLGGATTGDGILASGSAANTQGISMAGGSGGSGLVGTMGSQMLAQVSASVWNATMSEHTTAGSAGRYLTDASGSGAVTVDYAAISASVWNAVRADHVAATSFGQALQITSSFIDVAISSRHIGGGMVALSASEIMAISASVWNAKRQTHVTTDSFGQALQITSSFIDVAISTRSSGAVGLVASDIAAISASVWNAVMTNHVAAGSAGRYLTDASGSGGTATVDYAAISASVWNAMISDHSTPGTAGEHLGSSATIGAGDLAAISASVWNALTVSHTGSGTMARYVTDMTGTFRVYESEAIL